MWVNFTAGPIDTPVERWKSWFHPVSPLEILRPPCIRPGVGPRTPESTRSICISHCRNKFPRPLNLDRSSTHPPENIATTTDLRRHGVSRPRPASHGTEACQSELHLPAMPATTTTIAPHVAHPEHRTITQFGPVCKMEFDNKHRRRCCCGRSKDGTRRGGRGCSSCEKGVP